MKTIEIMVVCSVLLGVSLWYACRFSVRVRAYFGDRLYNWHLREISLLLFALALCATAFIVGGRWVVVAFGISVILLHLTKSLLHWGFVRVQITGSDIPCDLQQMREQVRTSHRRFSSDDWGRMPDRQRQWFEWKEQAVRAEELHEASRSMNDQEPRSAYPRIVAIIIYTATAFVCLLKW